MYSHDSPPQQPEVPRYDAPFLPGANTTPPSPFTPPSPVPPPAQKKTTRTRDQAPSIPRGKKALPIPSFSQKPRTRSSRGKQRGLSLGVKRLLAVIVFLVLAILAVSGFIFASHLINSNDNHPARTVVQDFYKAMKQKHYEQAFGYVSKNGLRDRFLALPGNTNIYANAGDFAKACQAVDEQKDPITKFSITNFNTTTLFNDPVTASVAVTRGGQTYTANLGLVQEGSAWKIDYVDNL